MKDSKKANIFKDIWMCVVFTYEMARDVHKFLREERLRGAKMLYRI